MGMGDTHLRGHHQDVILGLCSELEGHTGSSHHAVLVHVAELVVLVVLGEVVSFRQIQQPRHMQLLIIQVS